MPIFSEITKYQAHVVSPKRMAEFTNRAFNYAMLERGPVQLNIPRDHFYGDVVTKIPAPANTERSAGGPAALKVKYFKNSLFYFGRSFASENFT